MAVQDSGAGGFFALCKPPGISSARALSVVRGVLGSRRAGFLGTLDPPAAGVLPVAMGEATKLIPLLPRGDKEYVAELVLGLTTLTDDTSGPVTERHGAVGIREEQILSSLDSVASRPEQIPPHVSAKQLNGTRGYEAARRGSKLLDFAPEAVKVQYLRVLRMHQEQDLWHVHVRMSVTSGFYVRAFCRDVGLALGCGGCMGRLLRTQAYGYGIGQTMSLARLRTCVESGDDSFLTWGIDNPSLLAGVPRVRLDGLGLAAFRHGVSVPAERVSGRFVLVLDGRGLPAGIAQAVDGTLRPTRVLNT
ncbi:MAG TPA: tRNA pseudouridine(55) synthase TruB [Candidatus Cryosericum sp.]|nr:tRNA pseudouridine(55) synthase TruB [Candidatus Cryosericum sp.]HPS69426.1 tRNA pseudouridine(55) synthase TruB [Candidatus Cryosericum sp.]